MHAPVGTAGSGRRRSYLEGVIPLRELQKNVVGRYGARRTWETCCGEEAAMQARLGG